MAITKRFKALFLCSLFFFQALMLLDAHSTLKKEAQRPEEALKPVLASYPIFRQDVVASVGSTSYHVQKTQERRQKNEKASVLIYLVFLHGPGSMMHEKLFELSQTCLEAKKSWESNP